MPQPGTGGAGSFLDLFKKPAAAEPAPVQTTEMPAGQSVKVGALGQIDLHVKELDITQVLQLLSIQSQRNVVASRTVNGAVSADLYGVDFYEALDAILHTNGYGYREKGNFIYVYTREELKAMQEAERKPIHRIVRLNYITATDATAFVQPLLSSTGSISINGDVKAGFAPTRGDGGGNSYAHSDTLIIRDFAENVDEIIVILKEMDVRPKQVLVEATVLQASLSEENAFGVDLTILGDFALDQFVSPLSVVNQLLLGAIPEVPGGAANTTVGNTLTGASGVKVGIVTNSVSAFIRALDQVTDTTVLANPKLLVLNRQRADLLVGDRLGYLSTTQTETSATQTVEFLDVGTQLTLRPFISDDDFIRLELKPSISNGDTSRTLGSLVIPRQTTQELTTNVMVRNGQTVVLGGLFIENTSVARKQVPWLGDIPILGVAFKGQDDTVNRNEVIFMVTPTIVRDEALYAAGERAKDSAELASLGAREGLLPWSRSKMTAAHMRDALRHYDEGDTEKALWSTKMALRLDPTIVEAQRLKEQITGEREHWPDRSMLRDAIQRMVNEQLGETRSDRDDAQGGAHAPASSETPVAEDAAPAARPEGEQTAAVEPVLE